jgi:hypothetical protein
LILQPVEDGGGEINKRQLFGLKPKLGADAGQGGFKAAISFDNLTASREPGPVRGRLQPVAHFANRLFRVAAVDANVLTGDVGDKLPVSVLLAIENDSALLTLVGSSKALAAEKQSEFQRHVEPGQTGCVIERNCGKVVDTESALLDDALNLR